MTIQQGEEGPFVEEILDKTTFNISDLDCLRMCTYYEAVLRRGFYQKLGRRFCAAAITQFKRLFARDMRHER